MASRGDKDELTGRLTHFLSFSHWVSLPCSLVPKLMGKFNLNCQVKLTSLRLRKAISTVSVFLPSAAMWERALLSATGFSWGIGIWALHRWSTGVTAPILYPHTQVTLKRYEVPSLCTRQGRCFTGHCDAYAPSQKQTHCPGITAFLSKKHMIGRHWGFYKPFFCALAKYTDVITWKTKVLEFLPFL